MIAQTKIESVKQYLYAEFPDFEIRDAEDVVSWKFRVVKNSATFCDLKFERLFWTLFEDVKKVLKDLELSKVMKNNFKKTVIVTKEGQLKVF